MLSDEFYREILDHPVPTDRSRNAGRIPKAPLLAPADRVPQPYLRIGSHPDVVQLLWDQLGPALPEDCRAVVPGSPALVHLPAASCWHWGSARSTVCVWASWRKKRCRQVRESKFYAVNLPPFNIRRGLGDDWVHGRWLQQELDWCRSAYAAYSG